MFNAGFLYKGARMQEIFRAPSNSCTIKKHNIFPRKRDNNNIKENKIKIFGATVVCQFCVLRAKLQAVYKIKSILVK